MKLRAFIKRNARHALRRSWCRAASISLIAVLAGTLFTTIENLLAAAFGQVSMIDYLMTSGIYLDDLPNVSPAYMALLCALAIAELLLLAPVSIGIKRWFYLLGDGRADKTISIFEYCISRKRYFKVLRLQLSLAALTAVTSAVFLSPGIALYCFAQLCGGPNAGEAERLIAVGLNVSAMILGALLGILLLIHLTRYYLAPLVMIENESLNVRDIIKSSSALSKGRKLHLFAFEVSFIGWRILDFLIVPKLFTVPYRCTAQGLYARYIFEASRREENGQNPSQVRTPFDEKTSPGEKGSAEDSGRPDASGEEFEAVFSEEVIILGGETADSFEDLTEAGSESKKDEI